LNITEKDTVFEKAKTTIIISGASQAYDGAEALTANHGVVLGIGLPPTPVQIPVPLWGSRGLTFIRKCEFEGLGIC
jgi:hypothetical protein